MDSLMCILTTLGQLDSCSLDWRGSGRVITCGAISAYNSSQPYGIKNSFEVISMRLQIRGFIVVDYKNIPEHVRALITAAAEGELKVGMENEVSTKGSTVCGTANKTSMLLKTIRGSTEDLGEAVQCCHYTPSSIPPPLPSCTLQSLRSHS
jgi:hypothetical protein